MKLVKLTEGSTYEVLNEAFQSLHHLMNIYFYGIPKQKQVAKVAKLPLLGEAVSNSPGSIVITVVEEVFEQLTPLQQKMIAEDLVAQVMYDDEKDKISIEAPQIQMTIGGFRKYGKDLAEAYETATLVALQIEEQRKEMKAAAKKNKKQDENYD